MHRPHHPRSRPGEGRGLHPRRVHLRRPPARRPDGHQDRHRRGHQRHEGRRRQYHRAELRPGAVAGASLLSSASFCGKAPFRTSWSSSTARWPVRSRRSSGGIPSCSTSRCAAAFRLKDSPFDFPGLKFTETTKESKAINAIKGTVVVIAGSGMCTAGRIKHHLANNIARPESTIMFVGYQAVGTLGRRIVDGDPEVRILGDKLSGQGPRRPDSGLLRPRGPRGAAALAQLAPEAAAQALRRPRRSRKRPALRRVRPREDRLGRRRAGIPGGSDSELMRMFMRAFMPLRVARPSQQDSRCNVGLHAVT